MKVEADRVPGWQWVRRGVDGGLGADEWVDGGFDSALRTTLLR